MFHEFIDNQVWLPGSEIGQALSDIDRFVNYSMYKKNQVTSQIFEIE